MKYLNIIALVLSAWRITETATTQDGPFGLFKRLRSKWKVLQCPFCFSIWAAGISLSMFYLYPWVNWVFALSWSYGFSSLFAKRLAAWANEGAKKSRELLIGENGNQISVVRSDFTP